MAVSLRKQVVLKVIDGVAIVAGGSNTSDELETLSLDGFYSFEWIITGDGTAKLEMLRSLSEDAWVARTSEIATAQTKTSGTSGRNIGTITDGVPFNSIKLKVTETGGANGITISVWALAR